MSFRYIKGEKLSSADGLACDEALIISLERQLAPPALHCYYYTPSAIVGQFQNLQSSLRLDKCEAHGVEVNRRCSGGGTVFMSPTQMAMGFALPNDFPNLPKTIRALFEFLATPLSAMLNKYGIASNFEGKNDLQVEGKKIAGLAISQDSPSITFFHVSLLLDFDLPLMLEILNLPTEKFLDRGISCFGERMTTIKAELARSSAGMSAIPTIDDVIVETRRAFENKFGEQFIESRFTNDEKAIIEKLKMEKYCNDEWIYRTRSLKKRHVYVSKRTEGGLLQGHISFSGNMIETILLTGDYFSRTRDVCKLESLLRWSAATEESLSRALKSIRDSESLYRVKPHEIIELILEAKNSCKTCAD